MSYLRLLSRVSVGLALMATLAATVFGQVVLPEESIGGPLTGAPVLGEPFSADATTTVHATLGDGTLLDQTTTDRYYRDSVGRVRVERWIGLPAPSAVTERWVRAIIAPEPGHPMVYGIDDQTRTLHLQPRSIIGTTAGGGRWFHIYIGDGRFVAFRRAGELLSVNPGVYADVREESLGSRRIAGVQTIGRRVALVVPRGHSGNDQPMEITDERWESVELKLLIQSRHSDSRSIVEYRLSNIQRDEPPAHLFEKPADYTVGHPRTPDDKAMSFMLAESFRANRNR